MSDDIVTFVHSIGYAIEQVLSGGANIALTAQHNREAGVIPARTRHCKKRLACSSSQATALTSVTEDHLGKTSDSGFKSGYLPVSVMHLPTWG
ncbi:hypothetical protein PCCS19_55950 [Paenibacillus sp. CCS19]|nr:hypothetical protein PCCS19_55950 [Paenibacillus cellulosilyticus]